MLTSWKDSGVDWAVELSTGGPLIIGNQQTPYPFVSGGQYGIPSGWTLFLSVGAVASEVVFTTDTGLNRFSISNNLVTNLTGNSYGASVFLPIKPGHSYRIVFQHQVMDTKVAVQQNTDVLECDASFATIPTGYFAPGTFGYPPATWGDVSMNTRVASPNAAWMRFTFRAAVASGMSGTNWGIQWRDLVVVDIPPDSEIPPITWRDVTCDVRSIGTRYGRERFTNRYEVASCQLALNNDDGEYTYRDPHPFNLRPGRLLRARATHNNKTVSQFYGVIDSLTDGYSLDGHAITNVVAYDPQSLFSGSTSPRISFSPASPLSGIRVAGCLDVIGYRPRALDAGQWIMQSIQASGRSLRDEMGVTADSEGGSVFADRDGKVVYKDRSWETVDPNLYQVTADLVAAEHMDALPVVDFIPNQPGSPMLCPFELQTNWGLDRLMNTLTLANAGGSATLFVDTNSQLQFGIASYQRLDYVQAGAAAVVAERLAIRAKDLMDGYATPVQRVNSVTFRPSLFPGGWDWTLALFLNWTVRVWYTNPRNGWGFATVTHVQAIEHRITLDDWTVRLSLDRPMSFVTFIADPNGWDLGMWDDAIWNSSQDPNVAAKWSVGYQWSTPDAKWG